MKINKYWVLLSLVLIFSFIFRIYKINTLSLFGDEIDVGYQAFSLLQNGHDYKGNFLPVYVQSLSESRAPLLIYCSILGIKIFGLNEVGIRITPVFFGILSIYLLYKLVYLLSRSERLSLLSSLSLSLMPWHFHYSRSAFEVTLLISLLISAVYFIFKFLEKTNNKYLYLSIIFFCLSFYTYNTANIFVPLLVLSIFTINFKKIISKLNLINILISVGTFTVLVLPLVYQIFFGSAANRFNLISIFSNQQTIDQIISKRTSFSAGLPKVESIFHNKPIAWMSEFTKNYFTSFSLPFIFISGDTLNYRHSIPNYGLVFTVFLPFLLIGLFNLDLKNKLKQLMLSWLLISPIASSLTNNGGTHPTRLFLMIVPMSFFIGCGLDKIFTFKKKYSLPTVVVVTFILIFQVCGYTHEYFTHYPKDYFKIWNYGYQELFKSLDYQNNQTLLISNSNYNSLLPFLFYKKLIPGNFKLNDNEHHLIFRDFDGFQISTNIFFINNWRTSDIIQKLKDTAQQNETYLLFQLNEIPGDIDFSKQPIIGFKTIKTVYNPNNTILGQIIQKQ